MNCLCPGKPMSRIVDALLLKGKAEYGRGDLATAEEDLRACCAYKRAQGEDLFKTEEVRWLLGVMARQKDGTPRPHYSDQERHAICRELGLDMYSSKCMVCQACQRPPSADLRLKLCKQCQQSWYCSRECQRRHWPEHKRGCTPLLPRQNVIIMHTVEPKYKAAIDAGGFAFTEHKNAGTQALCVDPETGRMFQSITDHEIMFFDPNAEGNPLMGMMLGSLLGGGRQRRDGAIRARVVGRGREKETSRVVRQRRVVGLVHQNLGVQLIFHHSAGHVRQLKKAADVIVRRDDRVQHLRFGRETLGHAHDVSAGARALARERHDVKSPRAFSHVVAPKIQTRRTRVHGVGRRRERHEREREKERPHCRALRLRCDV